MRIKEYTDDKGEVYGIVMSYPKPTKKVKEKKGLIPTEYDECKTLVKYLDLRQRLGTVCLYTHIPNETFTKSWTVKGRNIVMGVRKGFPDYVVITPDDVYFIEMKRVKGGQVSPEQQDWIELLKHNGLKAKVCYGFDEAKEFLEA